MYTEKTNQELISHLKEYDNLTFESKLNLKEQIELRQLEVDQFTYDSFQRSIDSMYNKIENLEYLNHLGFEIDKTDSTQFTIKRTKRAKTFNIVGVISGFLLLFLGIDFIGSGSVFIKLDYSLLLVVISIFAGIALCVLGAFLLYINIDKLITYSGFEFLIKLGNCTLIKRIDWVKINFKKDIENLTIRKNDSTLYLYLDDSVVFRVAKPSLLNSLTLQALLKTAKSYY